MWHRDWSEVQVFILVLNLSSEICLELSGTKSHFFGASEESLSLAKYTELIFFQCWLASKVIVTQIKEKQFF